MCAKGSKKSGEKKDDRCRSWSFTQFKFENFLEKYLALECERLVIGREVCPKTGELHLQGYVRFHQPKRFSWWKNQFPTAHVEISRKGDAENEKYCIKDGDVVVNRGENHDENMEDLGMSKNEEALAIISEINRGAKFGILRRRYPLHTYWYRSAVLARIRDEQWYIDNGGDEGPDPVC